MMTQKANDTVLEAFNWFVNNNKMFTVWDVTQLARKFCSDKIFHNDVKSIVGGIPVPANYGTFSGTYNESDGYFTALFYCPNTITSDVKSYSNSDMRKAVSDCTSLSVPQVTVSATTSVGLATDDNVMKLACLFNPSLDKTNKTLVEAFLKENLESLHGGMIKYKMLEYIDVAYELIDFVDSFSVLEGISHANALDDFGETLLALDKNPSEIDKILKMPLSDLFKFLLTSLEDSLKAVNATITPAPVNVGPLATSAPVIPVASTPVVNVTSKDEKTAVDSYGRLNIRAKFVKKIGLKPGDKVTAHYSTGVTSGVKKVVICKSGTVACGGLHFGLKLTVDKDCNIRVPSWVFKKANLGTAKTFKQVVHNNSIGVEEV